MDKYESYIGRYFKLSPTSQWRQGRRKNGIVYSFRVI